MLQSFAQRCSSFVRFHFNHILINMGLLHLSCFLRRFYPPGSFQKGTQTSPTRRCSSVVFLVPPISRMFNPELTSNHQVLISRSDRPTHAATEVGFGKKIECVSHFNYLRLYCMTAFLSNALNKPQQQINK